MPRFLPWLKNRAEANHAPSGTATTLPPAFPPAQPQPAYRHFRDAEDNAASKTPPSSPLRAVQAELEYMVEGDDAWIMVEDELLSTAQTFTKSLHNDELRRLQKEAKARAHEMRRPVTGLPASKRLKTSRDANRAKLDRALDARAASDPASDADELEDEQDLLISDRNLAGLMFGEAHTRDLSQDNMAKLGVPKPKTRAAAGLSRQSQDRFTRLQPLAAPASSHVRNRPLLKDRTSIQQAEGEDDLDDEAPPPSRTVARHTLDEDRSAYRPPLRTTAAEPGSADEADVLNSSRTGSSAVEKWRAKKAAKQTREAATVAAAAAVKEEPEDRPVCSIDTIPMFYTRIP